MSREKQQVPQPENREARVFKLEFRAAGEGNDSRTITGYAAVFGKASEDMGFVEYIEAGAFTEAIGKSDVRALFNHDPNFILARTASGTLQLSEDETGLRYQFEAPNTSFGNDFLELVRRGDIRESSFSFTVAKQIWEEVKDGDTTNWIRRIQKVDTLYDVSPVTYPAYPETTVAIRSLDAAKADCPPIGDDDTEFFKRKIRLRELEASI